MRRPSCHHGSWRVRTFPTLDTVLPPAVVTPCAVVSSHARSHLHTSLTRSQPTQCCRGGVVMSKCCEQSVPPIIAVDRMMPGLPGRAPRGGDHRCSVANGPPNRCGDAAERSARVVLDSGSHPHRMLCAAGKPTACCIRRHRPQTHVHAHRCPRPHTHTRNAVQPASPLRLVCLGGDR